MFICGKMYSAYILLWNWPEGYRTNLKVTPVTGKSEVLETSLRGFPKSNNRITEVIENLTPVYK